MNPEYEKKLEAEIDAAFKGLPELQAPSTLARRVLAKTTQRVSVPWYRQSWEMWPAGLRFAALTLMLGSFCVLCVATWQLTRAAGWTVAAQEVGQTFSGVISILNAANALVSGMALAIKHLHPAILGGCLALFILVWSTCVGLGTAFVKLALARR